jgi:hypothetical protein
MSATAIAYRSSSTMVFAAEMIILSTKKMVEVTKEMVDLMKTGCLTMEMIFSAAKKIMSAAETIFVFTKTMAVVMQIIIAEVNKIVRVAKKMASWFAFIFCSFHPVVSDTRTKAEATERCFCVAVPCIWRREARNAGPPNTRKAPTQLCVE